MYEPPTDLLWMTATVLMAFTQSIAVYCGARRYAKRGISYSNSVCPSVRLMRRCNTTPTKVTSTEINSYDLRPLLMTSGDFKMSFQPHQTLLNWWILWKKQHTLGLHMRQLQTSRHVRYRLRCCIRI